MTLEALGEELGESNKATIAQQVIATPVDPKEQKIAYSESGSISIPSVAYSNPSGSTREVLSMKSFGEACKSSCPVFPPKDSPSCVEARGKARPTLAPRAAECSAAATAVMKTGTSGSHHPSGGQETGQGTHPRLG